MQITVHINDDTQPHKLLALAEAIRVLAGEKAPCTKTCGTSLQVTGDAKELPQRVAEALTDVKEPANAGPTNEHATDDGIQKCFDCGFYDCVCERHDGDFDPSVIFAKGIDGTGKQPGEELDTAAVFGNQTSAAPAPSTAGVAPSTTVQTVAPTAPCPPVPGAPANAATAGTETSAAPTAATTMNHAGVELDVNGLPWDARIHARTKAKIADGSWRGKRGVDPATVTAVTAELKAAMGAPATAQAPATVAPPVTTPAAPAVPGAPAVPALGPFPALMRALTPFICTEEDPQRPISQSMLRGFAAQLGLVNANNEGEIGMLMHRIDLIPAFRDAVNRHLAQWNVALGE